MVSAMIQHGRFKPLQGVIVEKVTALIMVLFNSFVILVGSPALAKSNAYDLKMELSLNGKHVSSPRILTKEGESASVTQEANGEKVFLDVIATEKPTNNKPGILLKFVVGTVSATGEKTTVSTPQIIALENEKAQISVTAKDREMSLSVSASRKTL